MTTAAQVLRRGDMPLPGEHVVIHLTGTDQGCNVTIDTPEGRTDFTLTRGVDNGSGFYSAIRRSDGFDMVGGAYGRMLARMVNLARGID